MDAQVAALMEHITASLPDLESARLSDEYYYASLPLCVIDAVFSIGVRYESTRRTVQRWCVSQATPWKRIARTACAKRPTNGPCIETFINILDGTDFESLAENFFGNHQRTSARNGILKAEAVYQFAVILRDNGINTFGQTECDRQNEKVREKICEIRGQRSGISFDYFLMLAGSDKHVKADRMLCAFVADALQESNVSADRTRMLVLAVCARLKSRIPDLTPRLLDHQIWKYQRTRSRPAMRRRRATCRSRAP